MTLGDMGGGGGVKNLKKGGTSFVNGPEPKLISRSFFKKYFRVYFTEKNNGLSFQIECRNMRLYLTMLQNNSMKQTNNNR